MAPGILERILNSKKKEIRDAVQKTSLQELRSAAEGKTDRRSFCGALNQHPGHVRIITEIKRASPSKGFICKDLDPGSLAAAYERGGGAALSVLTDSHFFKGSLKDLKAAREATSLPVLRKDFIISEYQVYEAAAHGADAVLLIMRILDKKQLTDLMSLCAELGIDALVEVHTLAELETAAISGAILIGINNRNLASFETDINNAIVMSASVRPGMIAVAASGIYSRADIEENLSAGISRFLIGESIVRSSDPESLLKHLVNG